MFPVIANKAGCCEYGGQTMTGSTASRSNSGFKIFTFGEREAHFPGNDRATSLKVLHAALG